MLCNEEKINTKSEIFKQLIQEAGIDEHSFIKGLNSKKLVYKNEINNLVLLTDECIAGIKNGNYYVGENRNGKMIRWLLKKD